MEFLAVFLVVYVVTVIIALITHVGTNRYIDNFESKIEVKKQYFITQLTNAKDNMYRLDLKVINKINNEQAVIGFHRALNEFSRDDITTILNSNHEGILSLFKKMNKQVMTYFVYAISRVELISEQIVDSYEKEIIKLTDKESVSLREYALEALSKVGSSKAIKQAYLELGKRGITHNVKLLSDGLLLNNSDKRKLAEELMGPFEEYEECYKKAIITFLYMENIHDYDVLLKEEILSDKLSEDICCDVMRLLGKDALKENGEFIIDYITTRNEEDFWESISVAIGTLEAYEKTDLIINVLKEKLKSPIWYIRMKSAASISSLGISQEEIEEINQGSDNYAKQALNYALAANRC